MKRSRLALFQSFMALLLCFSMLIGTTFAWFTDSVSSGTNMIAAGSLDIELDYLADDGTWKTVNESTEVLDKDALWEPGHTEVAYLRIKNAGSLALKYALGIGILAETGSINANGDPFKLSEHIRFGVVESETLVTYAEREDARKALAETKLICDGLTTTYSMKNQGDERYLALVVYMPEEVTNVANYATGATPPEIKLGIELVATQEVHESDSFGADYDTDAEMPGFSFPQNIFGDNTSSDVTTDDENKVAAGITIEGANTNAVIPAGVQLEEGTEKLTLEVTSMNQSGANVTLSENEAMRSLNVHVQGVSADNTVPMEIYIKEAAAKGLNAGNLKLYHVENGATVEMTAVDTFTAHNQFKYDPATGDITLNMATFSEVAMVADTENAWKGTFDYSWYTNAVALADDEGNADYTIANADQLAAFGAIVGGMNGQTQDSFTGKTVKLTSDINLGDKESENNPDLIFYPIGYYNSTGSYEKTSGGSVTSSVSSFEGTFDGQGHTVANFYQNTWEMFGDYNDGYSGTPNHYKDAMGLFGYVLNGTVKNLTVSNFSSDGEYTPTGVIAAYADGNSTFENIAITNCNPRVYNTGNGGIIGIAGDTSAADDDHITLKNITVDNSNKISALWGSWDVACGGLVGMYRGNVDGNGNATGDTISFENCHVSAIIDVYNDVCANYQYYAYRYAGMIIGSVRHNTTNTEGKTIPNMTGISATGCTVNYGDWNDYYYCEFVDNSIASYTHDYQFSRVPKSEIIFDAQGNITGCTHDHTKGGYETTDIDGDGVIDSDVLKEDKTAVYLPFHQLFTGYSWGVSSIGLEKYSGIATNLDITEGDQEKSAEKFAVVLSAGTTLEAGEEISVGSLFEAIDGVNINGSAVQVSVSAMNDSGIVGTYTANAGDWTKGTLKLNKTGGMCTVTIQDYNFCKPTTIVLKDGNLVEKFESKLPGTEYDWRIGNANEVALGSLLEVNEYYQVDSEDVKISVSGAECKPNKNDWTKGTVKFAQTGIYKLTISEGGFTKTLEIEVVDAVNATSATSAKSNNVVLLQDCGFSSLEVSGGYTLYGNGFTMTCSSDSAALNTGYEFVAVNNGTLDNVQVVCPNFDYAVLYSSNMTESGNRSETTDKTRYFNVKSAVEVNGNSQILNSRISGGRAALNVVGGNVVVENSRIELGAVASILVGSANSLTLRDVTLVQKPTASTYNPSKTLMGFSVLFVCDADGNTAPVTLEGTLVQNAWVDENDKQYVPSAGQSIISTVLGKTEYLHDIDGDGTKESLNLGFAYMPESLTSKVNTTTIKDNRTDKDTVPYDYAEVSILNGKTYVYSYKNTNGTADSFKTESEYESNKQGDIITVTYSDTTDGLESGKSFGTDGWVYELNVDLDKASGYKLDFSKLSMTVNGTTVTDYKVNGSAKPTSPVAVTAGGVTYTLTATIDDKEYTATYKVTGTETSKESPTLVGTPNYGEGFGVANKYNGDWSAAAPVLDGITVRYWSVAESAYKEFAFSSITFAKTGKQNGTNSYWEYTHTNNDFTLKLTNTVAMHDKSQTFGMPVAGKDGKLYFTIAGTGGFVSNGTTSRSITIAYEFTDNNGGDTLKFSHTWSIPYSKDEQYNYSSFTSDGTLTKLESSSGGGITECITPDTLITLADGSQVRVDSLTGNEELLVWNLETGKYDTAPIVFVDNDAEQEYEIIHLYFSDGSDVKVISEHGFFDLDLGKYVYIDANNYADYIGHRFVSEGDINSNNWNVVTLDEVVIETEVTTAWSPVTFEHLCYFTNGVLSMPGGIEGLFNIFEVDTDRMIYDAEQMQKDIETYGLFTIEDFDGMITEDAFHAFNGAYLKVAMGKGLLTWEDIAYMAERYIPLM